MAVVRWGEVLSLAGEKKGVVRNDPKRKSWTRLDIT